MSLVALMPLVALVALRSPNSVCRARILLGCFLCGEKTAVQLP